MNPTQNLGEHQESESQGFAGLTQSYLPTAYVSQLKLQSAYSDPQS